MERAAFERLRDMFCEASGIRLGDDKLAMVDVRLRKRVEALGLQTFDEYCDHLERSLDPEERQHAVDLLTTNETYFFREPAQFEFLSRLLTGPMRAQPLRLWSAACSTGEEPYSLAMLLFDKRPEGGWELRASDLSRRTVERARRGVYPAQRLQYMPQGYLQRFCLRGTGQYAGMFRVDERVRRSIDFFEHNLLADSPQLGSYEVIFLRNVLIYFDAATRTQILRSIANRLRPGGFLFIGQAESIHGERLPLERVSASVFEKHAVR